MANRASSKYLETYTSFSGADCVATFNAHVIGTLAGITWSISREKAAVYTMGSANARSFSRGKRGIAGTLMFQVFDRDVLWQLVQNDDSMLVYKRTSEWAGDVYNTGDVLDAGSGDWRDQTLDVVAGVPFYADELPPFDIVLTEHNELGNFARKEILGCEILNEGSGVSMDDILQEQTMTYVARAIGKMMPDKLWMSSRG